MIFTCAILGVVVVVVVVAAAASPSSLSDLL